MSKGQKGRKHSEETKQKMSEIRKKIWGNNEFKEKMSGTNSYRYGKTESIEFCNLQSKIKKKFWTLNPDKKLFAEKNPNWNGGSSFEPYAVEFNEKLKDKIRKRDSNSCVYCGSKTNPRKLPIHHIDYNKKNNSELNLITLCDSCHSYSNYNRNKWEFCLTILQKYNIRWRKNNDASKT